MRILVISNLYPPYYVGGAELVCKDAVDGLTARGHMVQVLTSSYGLAKPAIDGEVSRTLNLHQPQAGSESRLTRLMTIYFDPHNYLATRSAIARSKPQVIYLATLRGLSASPIAAVHHSHLPFVYHLDDYWFHGPLGSLHYSLTEGTPLKKALKTAISKCLCLRMRPPFAITVSNTLRDYYSALGLEGEKTVTIYNGIDVGLFQPREQQRTNGEVRLLYVGRMDRRKGLHIALLALSELVNSPDYQGTLHLSIYGGDWEGGYEEEVHAVVKGHGLEDKVTLHGKVSRDDLIRAYQGHDILLVPSLWEEPFGLTTIEGMACGIAVVGAARGGIKEVIVDGENGLLVPPGDASALARAIRRLADDHELRHTISKNGIACVRERFSREVMVSQIERYLMRLSEA